MAENEGLVLEIMTSFGMAIPSGLTNEGWLRDLEERLTDFTRLWYFIKNTKVDELIKEEVCTELFGQVKLLETEVQQKMVLNEGEIWTLAFLRTMNKSDFVAFIQMTGPLDYMVRIAADIKAKGDSLTSNIRAALFIYLFQNLYELLMADIDACFYVYLNENPQVKGQSINNYRKKFIADRKQARSMKEDIGEHATAGFIQGMLEDVYKEECTSNQKPIDTSFLADTIFNQMTEKFRNSSAHFNAFYDDKRNKIIFLNGAEMTIDEFIALYERLFLFLTRWMDLYLSGAKDGKAFTEKMKLELGKMLSQTESVMHGIQRSGRANAWNAFVQRTWGNSIVKFKEKEEDKKQIQQ